jgi:putative SOS response-associated peptidase YedK
VGLVPHFTKDLKETRKPINARAETVATSGMFRGGLRGKLSRINQSEAG